MKDIIFDTDLGGDCDDVMALDLLIQAHKSGACRLIGVTYSADAEAAPACIRAILIQHGMEGLPIGRAPIPDVCVTKSDTYASAVARAFPNGEKDTQQAVGLLRRLLSEHDRVTLVVTGFLTNIAALLESVADEASPLSGADLVRERVAEIALMGCNFSHINRINPEPGNVCADGRIRPAPEWNIVCDIPAAQLVFARSPVRVTVCPFEVGRGMLTGGPMCRAGGGKTPDSMSYAVHGSANGRDSWDPATALYAVYGDRPWFVCSEPGRVSVNKDGISDFTPGKGNHVVLRCSIPQERIAEDIDRLVMKLFE